MSVSSLGVGSGLDLESLVQNMVSVQRDARVASYKERINDYKTEVSGYGSIKSALEKFEESVKKLSDSDFFTGRSANTTQPTSGDIVSISADSSASNGSYSVSVSQLAQGSRSLSAAGLFSSSDDVVSATGGDLTFTAGSETFSITVAAGTTLSELREQINDDADNFGVSANLVDDGNGNVYLSLGSNVTGSGNDLSVTNTDASLDNVSSVATGAGPAGLSIGANDAATNAIINVDGIDITSDTNTFDSAVSGLTIKALAVSPDDTNGDPEVATAVIDYDSDTVKETLDSFVSSYNKLLSVFDSATAPSAIFNGSSLIRGLESGLNSNLMTTFSNAGNLSTIFDIGIEMANDGTLSIDSSAFSDAMDANYDDVATLFSDTGGLASIMETYLDSYTGSDGMLKDMSDLSQEAVKRAEGRLENYEYRMDQYESQLRDRFTQLDGLLAGLNSNGNYLLTQLSSLNNSSS